MEKLDLAFNILENRREIMAHIESLIREDLDRAGEYCLALTAVYESLPEKSKAVAGAFAACLSSYLLHKKNKTRLIELIREQGELSLAFFGRLDTYKYSLVFVLKRIFRENDKKLVQEVLDLLFNNPFRNEGSKPYSDSWSLAFVIDEALKAPEDYLNLKEDTLEAIEVFKAKLTAQS